MTDRALGELEHVVLLAILRLGADAYGVPIVEEITRQSDRAVARTAVYVALTRLERRGLVQSRLGEPTPERGGRARRYFRVLPAGLERVRASRAMFGRMWDGLESVIE
jgi:PadR family transcriptional regulator PadR